METVGIIAEYNPFHNGHAWHLQQARSMANADCVLAVMSGNFTQRGNAAIADKWHRAKIAVANGIDLVLELPHCFATQSAEGFASGAVRLLQATGIVNTIACGSESANTNLIQKTAQQLQKPATQDNIRSSLRQGKSYAASICSALNDEIALSSHTPNDILAVEYYRAILKYKLDCNFVTIKRHIAQHKDEFIDNNFASASAIRKQLYSQTASYLATPLGLPTATSQQLHKLWQNGQLLTDLKSLDIITLYKLRSCRSQDLQTISGIKEGLDMKIWQAAQKCLSSDEIIKIVKSKRYHHSRLQRSLLNIVFSLSKIDCQDFNQLGPSYIRPLAFNDAGRKMLALMRKQSSLPIVIRLGKLLNSKTLSTVGQRQLHYDIISSNIYNTLLPIPQESGKDYLQKPIYM